MFENTKNAVQTLRIKTIWYLMEEYIFVSQNSPFTDGSQTICVISSSRQSASLQPKPQFNELNFCMWPVYGLNAFANRTKPFKLWNCLWKGIEHNSRRNSSCCSGFSFNQTYRMKYANWSSKIIHIIWWCGENYCDLRKTNFIFIQSYVGKKRRVNK